MMKRRVLIFAVSLLTVLLTACHPDNVPTENGPTLSVAIDFPAMQETTKADVGEMPAFDVENALHSLSLWIFRSDNHRLVAQRNLEEEDFPAGGGVRNYALAVSREFAAQAPDVDVFVLGNAASIGCDLDEESTWDDLNDAFFEDSETGPYYGFGVTHPVHAVDSSLGLPMSVARKNMTIRGEAPVLRVGTVSLTRAVSRLRYVFCKTKTEGGEEDEVAIRRIILSGGTIPLKEYVFTTEQSGVVLDDPILSSNYVSMSYIVDGPSEIADNDMPENLIYVNQDPDTYRRLLDDAVADGTLTDLGYTYFRESDQRLMGRIEYTINGKERIREFNMAAPGDFARNRTWTLFGYFLSGRNLQLALSVQPWDYNRFYVDFSHESVNVSSKFVVDTASVDLVYTSKDHYDARLLPGTAAKGHIIINTPVGARLMIRSIGDAYAFSVSPEIERIDPSVNNGRIDIDIRRNPDLDEDLSGKFITLSFSVETDDGRTIDANTEAVDVVYRFVI